MLTFDANLQLALDLVGIFAFALTGGGRQVVSPGLRTTPGEAGGETVGSW